MSDYIKRKDALELIESAQAWGWSMNTLHSEIQALPAEDVVPVVHAKWIESVSFESGFWVCSNCSFVSEAIAAPKLYNYCPNCGAKCDLEGYL